MKCFLEFCAIYVMAFCLASEKRSSKRIYKNYFRFVGVWGRRFTNKKSNFYLICECVYTLALLAKKVICLFLQWFEIISLNCKIRFDRVSEFQILITPPTQSGGDFNSELSWIKYFPRICMRF